MAKKKIEGATLTGKKRKAASGRKVAITPEIIENVIFSLKAGCYIETAAAYAGISRSTLYQWMKRGQREKRRLQKKRTRPYVSEAQFVIFVDAITRAMAESEVRDVSVIAQAANGGYKYTEKKVKKDSNGNIISEELVEKTAAPQWQAAAWRLERKNPKKWGRRVAIRKDDGNDDKNSPEAFANKMREAFGTIAGIIGSGIEEPMPDKENSEALNSEQKPNE